MSARFAKSGTTVISKQPPLKSHPAQAKVLRHHQRQAFAKTSVRIFNSLGKRIYTMCTHAKTRQKQELESPNVHFWPKDYDIYPFLVITPFLNEFPKYFDCHVGGGGKGWGRVDKKRGRQRKIARRELARKNLLLSPRGCVATPKNSASLSP